MKRIFTALGAIIVFAGLSSAANAEPLQIALDKYKLLRFNRDLSTVLLANPTIADVGVESQRLLVLVGRMPGETMLVVLDKNGREMLKESLVVIPNPDREITVHRGSVEFTLSCGSGSRCTRIPSPDRGGADARKAKHRKDPRTPIGGGGASEEGVSSAAEEAPPEPEAPAEGGQG